MQVAVQGIDVKVVGIGIQRDALHEIGALLQFLHRIVGQRHIALRIEAHQVFHRNAQFLHDIVVERLLQLHMIGVLHIVGLLVGLSVNVDNVVFYLQGLSRQSDTAFHIVLAAIGRTGVYHSVFSLILHNSLPSCLIDGIEIDRQLLLRERVRVGAFRIHLVAYLVAHLIEVVGLIARIGADGVACGIVEHHDVVELYLA